MRKIFLFLAILVLSFLPLSLTTAAENPQTENIQSYNIKIQINTDSTINVREEIHYFFPSPRHGIYRYIPKRYLDEKKDRYFQTPITNIQVTNAINQPLVFSEETDKNYLTLKIGEANKTVEDSQTYIISYKVTGVLNYFSDSDELYWNATGNSWGVPINNVTAEITLPEKSENLKSTCYTGETGSTAQNCQANTDKNIATYQSAIGPLTIVAGWNKGLVSPIERVYEIRFRHESPWFLFLPILVLIFLIVQYIRHGRDPFGRGTIAPEFEPPENLLPAEIGTLIDEKADNLDITATIIDLAVRGFLKIKEKNKKYTLIKTKEADNTLRDYEKNIFNDIFSSATEVKLSDLYKDFTHLGEIKNKLYQDLLTKKYFTQNPLKVRNKYFIIGILIICSGGFFAWLSWILVFSLIVSGIIFFIFARFMSKKTREGVIVKEKSLGFKEFLYRAERYRIHWQEKEGIFEKYLPYAMVFSIAEVWAKNFKDLYKKPPEWYEGDFTTFNAVVFAHSMTAFSSTATHSFSPPSTSASSGGSGFGGGGSSGGGFGGGGGGSW